MYIFINKNMVKYEMYTRGIDSKSFFEERVSYIRIFFPATVSPEYC